MAYTPEERKEARKVARAKWAAKNVDKTNARRRAHRAENPELRRKSHEEYMRGRGATKQRRRKKPPGELKQYKREHGRKMYGKNPRRHYVERYGIVDQDYYAILESQGGGCAICKAPPPNGKKKRLAIDHCHSTDVVRGLLCHSCNVSLGLMKDDPERLVRAAAYLRKSFEDQLHNLLG